MSEFVDELPALQGRPPIYPWESWMNIDRENEYGEEAARPVKLWKDPPTGPQKRKATSDLFKGQARSFRVLAHRTAKSYGLKVRTAIDDDGESIVLEFYVPDGEE